MKLSKVAVRLRRAVFNSLISCGSDVNCIKTAWTWQSLFESLHSLRDPAPLKLLSEDGKEKIKTPLGIIESYKFRFKNGTISPDVLEKTLLISNKIESTLWYDANKGVLLKEETKTDKGDIYKFTINKTNINLSIIGGRQ